MALQCFRCGSIPLLSSAEVLQAIESYFEIWTQPVITREDEMPEGYKEQRIEHDNELKRRVDKIFQAIRTDIQTVDKERSYQFKPKLYPVELIEGK